MKKKIILILLAAVIILPAINSCKKGSEDPFFSFRSRTKRLVGDWNIESVVSFIETKITTNGTNATSTYTTDFKITGTKGDEIKTLLGVKAVNNKDSIVKTPGTVLQYAMSFDKNGYARIIYEYQVVDVKTTGEGDDIRVTTTTTNYKEETNGTWDFMSGADDYKKKERLIIVLEDKIITTTVTVSVRTGEGENMVISPPVITRTTDTRKWGNGESAEVWELVMLKYKDIKLHRKVNYYGLNLNGDNQQDVGEETIVLKRNDGSAAE